MPRDKADIIDFRAMTRQLKICSRRERASSWRPQPRWNGVQGFLEQQEFREVLSQKGSLRAGALVLTIYSGGALHFQDVQRSDDEEALRWAALEKLPTLDRLHTTILQKQVSGRIIHEEVDVRRMGFVERQQIIDRLLKVTEEDNDRFLKKLRARIDRVAIKLPTIEVRYENLTVCATCFFGGRTLPILRNSTLNFLEVCS